MNFALALVHQIELDLRLPKPVLHFGAFVLVRCPLLANSGMLRHNPRFFIGPLQTVFT